MPPDYLLQPPEPQPYVYEPIYYFFYGTLTDPAVLKDVLGLDKEPPADALRKARIYGYALTSWGPYRALVEGTPGQVVEGRAYLVQSVEHEYRLARYETSAYALAPCLIYFGDEKKDQAEEESAYGRVFMYAGDEKASQGVFDQQSWEMQMGSRLPPDWPRRSG